MINDSDFTKTCTHFLARTAINASEEMTTDDRIMILTGIIELFAEDTAEHSSASKMLETLTDYKSRQMNLFRSLQP